MSLLRFDLSVTAAMNPGEELKFDIDGAVMPSNLINNVNSANSEIALDSLQLGFGVFSDSTMKQVLLEGQAEVVKSAADNFGRAAVRMLVGWTDETLHRLYLLTYFSYRNKTHHPQIELAKKCFVLERRGSEIICLPGNLLTQDDCSDLISDDLENSKWFYVDDPFLLIEFSKCIDAICLRFGLRIGLTFGYYYALGRPPDPRGLNEKMREVVTGRSSIAQVCETFISSEEFQRRNLDLLPHPQIVIGSWAALRESGFE